jgi:hypothetical protein
LGPITLTDPQQDPLKIALTGSITASNIAPTTAIDGSAAAAWKITNLGSINALEEGITLAAGGDCLDPATSRSIPAPIDATRRFGAVVRMVIDGL